MAGKRENGCGGEHHEPAQAPPELYLDPASGLMLPQGTRLAERAQVARAWFLGLGLFIATLGIGYVVWSMFEWGQGRTPAQRMLGLRCWLPGPRRVAGRRRMAARQVTGFLLNGQALAGIFIFLGSEYLRSVGDYFARTVLLSDPDGVLRLCSRTSPPPAASWRASPCWRAGPPWWCTG